MSDNKKTGTSASASTSNNKNETTAATETTTASKPVHLSALEEDDEFEEFTAQDWDDTVTELKNLKGVAPGGAKSLGDRLWEDNWDEDDIEEDFNLQLRNELAKSKSGGDAMQH